ncbi:MAG TPA: FlgD immunoglobulin-like domain containing protein, partial [Candidatus Eisenbacteria bacterium]|nr:FlgD immunoglobulin-like domain containing protein [Candidatus Eisenbacteria bacterium]
TIPVDMAVSGRAQLTIHDLSGRLVRRLAEADLPAGRREFAWDLRDEQRAAVRSGIYFCRLVVDGRPADRRRLMVVR